MMDRTQLYDLDAARQAYQFGRTSYRRDAAKGTLTRNPYLRGSFLHAAFEEGRRREAGQPISGPAVGNEGTPTPGLDVA
jgi:hypothetical protein